MPAFPPSTADYHFRAADGAHAGAQLIVLFHGTGGDENQFFDIAAEIVPGAARLAPRGTVDENGAWRYFRRRAAGVYDMDDLARRTQAMLDFVREKAAARQPGRLFGLGYSNGANLLAAMQFSSPDLFDATALLHPLIPFTPPPADFAGRQVLLTAGRRDPMAPEAATTALAAYFTANHARTQLVWQAGGHEVAGAEWAAARDFFARAGTP